MTTVELDHNLNVREAVGFRLSWGAIFAGLVTATGLQIVLTLLAIGLGIRLGTSAALWAGVSALIALFVGGLAAGRLAGILPRKDAALHAVVLWGLSTLLTVWMIWSGLGFLIGNTLNIVGQTAAAAVGGVTQIGAAAVGQAGSVDLSALEHQIETTLRQTKDPALQPESLQAAANRVGKRATGPASNQSVVEEIAKTITNRAGHVDQQDIVNVIVARTNLSQAEAQRVAERIQSAVGQLGASLGNGLHSVGARVAGAAQDVEDAVQSAAWWSLLMLGLGLAAAVGGTVLTARQ